MPRLLEIREICERALRKIGAYSINDEGAEATQMEEARRWLDLIVGHLTARRRTWWLVPETALLTLQAGRTEYPLRELLPGAPQVQHAIAVSWRERIGGRTEDMPLARRFEWDARQPKQAGRPELVYVDRDRMPVLYLHPAPAAPPTHDLLLTFQRFAADMTRGAPTTPMPDLRETWNLYLITALAYELGNGPVRKLPGDEVREMAGMAERLLGDLEAYENHEQASEPRRVAYNDF